MLKQLKVTNFRRLRQSTIDFTPGLNVVRGQNEAGKSTMLEAITYAFFGVSACRTSLAEMVTWGEKESSLKVHLAFEIEGVEYTISRGKSGAEVNWTGGRVTGQKEVAAWVGRAFGVSSQNVNRLILSGQGNIRGALGEGSTKTAELIEQLANFSVIDDVIELISSKLTTGAVAPFEERAAALLVELEQLEAALTPPDTAADETRLLDLNNTKVVVEEEAEAILEAVGPMSKRRDELRAAVKAKSHLEGQVALLKDQAGSAARDLGDHQRAKVDAPDQARVAELRGDIAQWQQLQERTKGKASVASTCYNEDNFWEGDLASFEKAVEENAASVMSAQQWISDIGSQIKQLQYAIVAAGTCGHCGQDFSKLPAAIEKNTKCGAQIEALKAQRAEVEQQLAEGQATRTALQQCAKDQQRIQNALARFGEDVAWDTNVVPFRPRWVGPVLVEDPASLQQELLNLERRGREFDQWEALHRAKAATWERAKVAHANAVQKLTEGIPGVDELPALESECDRLNEAYSTLYSSLSQTQTEAAEILARVSAAKATYAAAAARVEQVRTAKAEAEKTIDEIGFNNALKKRVSAARPVIANKLWSMVLTAVSRYFSQMRGTDSVVTKDGEGFKVDGKVIEALSGSTLDILGLAIRLALVRTFLPHTPLLILDEPSAACDVTRTEAMMGFLVSCGFDQMLLVTHEDMSEKVAENLIAI